MSTHVHDQVKNPSAQAPSFTPDNKGFVQRKCADDECRKKKLTLQRYSADSEEPSTVPPIVHEVLRSPGQPLDPATRAFMEPRFGHDFSKVRVHTDARAAESARAVNAQAYTVGLDVVFGAGHYLPTTSKGIQLLTHELAHVVQQNRGGRSPSEQFGTIENDAAHAATVPVQFGVPVLITTASSVDIARKPDEEQTGVAEHDEAIGRLVQMAIEETEGNASGKVLIGIFQRTGDSARLKRWALELQSRRTSQGGNYLYFYFKKLHNYNTIISNQFLKMLTDAGIAVSPESGAFQSLEYLDPSVRAPVNPEVAKVPIRCQVDKFDKATYDPLYTVRQPGLLSEWLQLSYADGTKIDIDIYNISDNIDPAPGNAIARSYIGPGRRVFPSRMSRNTVPRLWIEKQNALVKMQESNQDYETLVSIELTAAMSSLPIGPVVTPETPVTVTSRSRGTRVGTRVPTPAKELVIDAPPAAAPKQPVKPPHPAAPAEPTTANPPKAPKIAGSKQTPPEPVQGAAQTGTWDDLLARAERPTPRQTTGGFRSSPPARIGNREVRIIEGPVGEQVPESKFVSKVRGSAPTLKGEHATHVVGLQMGENLPEGLTSAPPRFNVSEMKVVENSIRETADAAVENGARVETKTVLQVEYVTKGGQEIPVLVGVKREAWVVVPGSDKTIPFVDFSARLDPVTRKVVVDKQWIMRPSRYR